MGDFAFNMGVGQRPLTLDPMAEIQQAQAQGKQSRLVKLLGAAANGQGDYTQANLIDPITTQSFQANQEKTKAERFTSFAQKAALVGNLWATGQKAAAQSIYPEILAEAHALNPGFQLDPQMSDAAAQVFTTLGGPKEQPTSVQEYAYAKSHPDFQTFLDGRAPATPFAMPVPGGTQTVLYNSRTRQFTNIDGSPVDTGGGSPQGAQVGPDGSSPPAGQVLPAVNGAPVTFSADMSPAQRADIIAHPEKYGATLPFSPPQAAPAAPQGAPAPQAGPQQPAPQMPPQGQPPRLGFKPDNEERFSTLTPDEVKAAGLPDGTFAQRSSKTGKIDVGPAASKHLDPTDPATVDYYATQSLNGDYSWQVGLGRGQVGQALIAAVKNRIPVMASELGLSARDQTAAHANIGALTATLKQQTEYVTSVERQNAKLKAQAGLVLQLMGKGAANGGSPVINRWIQAGRRSIAGDPDVTAFDNAIRGAAREHQMITTSPMSNGQLPVASQITADSLLNSSMSPAQIRAAVQEMMTEGDNSQRVGVGILNNVRGQLSGRNTQQQGAPQRISTQAQFDALPKGSIYISPDDGKPHRKP